MENGGGVDQRADVHRRGRKPLALYALLAVAGLAQAAPPLAAQEATTQRIGAVAGAVDVAIDISRATFADDEATVVVLGRDDVFADNLAGAALAGTDGPLLYTPGGPGAVLPPAVADEIERVLADGGCDVATVALLGGTSAVSAAVEQELRDAGRCVQRYAGASRVETALAVADALGADAHTVLLARADEWADAATGGALAAAQRFPILVTPREQLHPGVAARIERDPAEVRLLGGRGALAQEVEDALADVYSTRLAGPARDATAVAIADSSGARDAVVLVNGYAPDGWVHALACAVPAARAGGPVLYVQGDDVSETTRAWLQRSRPGRVIACGPRERVGDAAVALAADPPAAEGRSPLQLEDGTPVDALATRAVTDCTDDPCSYGQVLGVNLTTGASGVLVRSGAGASWSPTADRVAWITRNGDNDPGQVFVATAGAGGLVDPRPVGALADGCGGAPPDYGVQWSPSGTHVMVACPYGFHVLAVDGSSSLLMPPAGDTTDYGVPHWSASGDAVYAARRDEEVVRIGVLGGDAGQVTPVPGAAAELVEDLAVCRTPDGGSTIVYTAFSNDWAMYVTTAAGPPRVLTTLAYLTSRSVCAPDGSAVAAAEAGFDGPSTLLTVRLSDGVVTRHPRGFHVRSLDWEPEGAGILLAADDGVHRVAVPLGGETRTFNLDVGDADVHPVPR